MQLRDTLQSGLKMLLEQHVPSAQLAAELLLMHVLGCDRGYLHSHPEVNLPPEIVDRYFRLVAERATGKPTQYITGHQEFWGLDFEVTPDVLIPRPETEHLVEVVLELLRRDTNTLRKGCRDTLWKDGASAPPQIAAESFDKSREDLRTAGLKPRPFEARSVGASPRIVDVGTGSGCIALALASELSNTLIVATDVSRPALEVAQRNARRLGLADPVRFVEADLLNCFGAQNAGAFDFVVSNPPYISLDEIGSVQREVRDFEPRIALGGSCSGAEIYGRLFSQAFAVLRPGGYVAVEIGYNQSDAVLRLLEDGWDQAEVQPDLAGIPRVVIGRKQSSAVSYQPSAETQTESKGGSE